MKPRMTVMLRAGISTNILALWMAWKTEGRTYNLSSVLHPTAGAAQMPMQLLHHGHAFVQHDDPIHNEGEHGDGRRENYRIESGGMKK